MKQREACYADRASRSSAGKFASWFDEIGDPAAAARFRAQAGSG